MKIDLDYQPQFDYWSCYDKEKLTDKTGYILFFRIL